MTRKNVTQELACEMARLYLEEGWPATRIADELGFGTTTVYRHLKRSGIVPSEHGRVGKGNKPYKYPPEVEQQIAQEYARGDSLSALAGKYGCCLTTVREIVRRNSGRLRRRGGRRKRLTQAQRQDVLRLYAEQGWTQEAVADELDLNVKRVQRYLEKQGIVAPNRRERHGSWKGGRVSNAAGYVLIRPPATGPYLSMVDSNGYVLEHRLVMAKALGRPLREWETVHHIDGNPANNGLENLQLRVGNHGHHVAYRCADCGSMNIEPCELD